jgi:hypothetical protein
MDENNRRLDYAHRKVRANRTWRHIGLTSVALCILQFPWTFLAAWIAWSILFGDIQPPKGEAMLFNFFATLPIEFAAVLGAYAAIRPASPRERILGAIAVAGSIAWLRWLWVSAFLA